MEAIIQNPHNETLCAPITTGHHMADLLIGNIPLRQLMETELRRAGFEIVEPNRVTPSTVHLPLDHWVEVGALCLLARQEPGTCLYDSEGDIVAWKGCDSPDKCEKKTVTEATCFRMRYPWEILQLNAAIVDALPDSSIKGTISHLSEYKGKLHLGEGSHILPGVYIEGNVTIGKNCKIGPNAYIRGNTAIGDNCIIGHSVEIKNSLIGHHTSIAHLSFVGDSYIGSHVNIGAGTIFSNYRHDGKNHRMMIQGVLHDTGMNKFGAIVGDGVRTGANTIVYPGRKIGKARTTQPGAIVKEDLV